MGYRPSKKLVVSLIFHKIFFVLITSLSLLISFTAKSQKQPPVKICNFWIGDITVIRNYNRTSPNVATEVVKTVYHVRLREETINQLGTEIRLINDNSKAEGEIIEVDEGSYGYGNTGSHKQEGNGTVKVIDPGSNFGSVGAITLNGKGKRLQYRFEMWPDKGSEKYPVVIHSFVGDPPKENVFEQTNTYRSAVTKGDTSGFASWANFTSDGLMEGTYTYIGTIPGISEQRDKTSWKLHMIKAPCRQSNDLDTTSRPKDPCPPPTTQLALLQLGLSQQKALLNQSGQQYKEIRKLQEETKQWKNDYDQAARECTLWQIAQALTNYLVGNEEGAMGAAGKQLSNFLSFLDKLSDGDASWMLPNEEYKEWFSAEDAWEGFHAAYDQLAPESKPQGLIDQLRKCSSPTGDGVMEGAIHYLRLLQQIETLAPAAQKTLNDIRNKDLEILDLWNKYHEACVAHAKCKGTDTGECDQPVPKQ